MAKLPVLRQVATTPLIAALLWVTAYTIWKQTGWGITADVLAVGAIYFTIRTIMIWWMYAGHKRLIDSCHALRSLIKFRRGNNFHRVYQHPESGTIFYFSFNHNGLIYVWGVEWNAFLLWKNAYWAWTDRNPQVPSDEEPEPPRVHCVAYVLYPRRSQIDRFYGEIIFGRRQSGEFFLETARLRRENLASLTSGELESQLQGLTKRLQNLKRIGGKRSFTPQPPTQR